MRAFTKTTTTRNTSTTTKQAQKDKNKYIPTCFEYVEAVRNSDKNNSEDGWNKHQS